jgi:hypothetical protein
MAVTQDFFEQAVTHKEYRQALIEAFAEHLREEGRAEPTHLEIDWLQQELGGALTAQEVARILGVTPQGIKVMTDAAQRKARRAFAARGMWQEDLIGDEPGTDDWYLIA